MGTVKHTPGPWLAGGGWVNPTPENYPADDDTGDFHSVAHCFGPNAEANASLIAAAPEMLDILLEIEAYGVPRFNQRIRGLIAKAEGRSGDSKQGGRIAVEAG